MTCRCQRRLLTGLRTAVSWTLEPSVAKNASNTGASQPIEVAFSPQSMTALRYRFQVLRLV